jgi:hypothetical protein
VNTELTCAHRILQTSARVHGLTDFVYALNPVEKTEEEAKPIVPLAPYASVQEVGDRAYWYRIQQNYRLMILARHFMHVLQASNLLRNRIEEIAATAETLPSAYTGPVDPSPAEAQVQAEAEAEAEVEAEADDGRDSSRGYPDGASGGSDFDHGAWVQSAVKASSNAIYRAPKPNRRSWQEAEVPRRASRSQAAKVRSRGAGPQDTGEEGAEEGGGWVAQTPSSPPAVNTSGSPAARRKSRRITDPHPSADGEAEVGEGGEVQTPNRSPKHRGRHSVDLRNENLGGEEGRGSETGQAADREGRAARRSSRVIPRTGLPLKALAPRADEGPDGEAEASARGHSGRMSQHRARPSVSSERGQSPQEGLTAPRTAVQDMELRAARRHKSLVHRDSADGGDAGVEETYID